MAKLQKFPKLPSVIFFSPLWILCKDGRFMKYERQLNNVSQRQDLKGRCWYYYIILGSWYSGPTWPALVIQSDSQAECWSDNTKNVKRNKLSSRTASHRYLAWLGPSLVIPSFHTSGHSENWTTTNQETNWVLASSFLILWLSSLLSPLSSLVLLVFSPACSDSVSVGPGLVAISQDQNIPKNPIINIPPRLGHVVSESPGTARELK